MSLDAGESWWKTVQLAAEDKATGQKNKIAISQTTRAG
jgi:hypothetical protein